MQVIGHGTFDVKDSSVFGRCFISLRYDYGCHFDGNMSIRNSKWLPKGQHPVVIGCANEEDHDFGYTCKMPKNIVIENLLIDDTNCPEAEEICLLSDYKPDPDSPRTFPYIARTPSSNGMEKPSKTAKPPQKARKKERTERSLLFVFTQIRLFLRELMPKT